MSEIVQEPFAEARGYAARVDCKLCGGVCYLPTVPLEPCEELHRAQMRLCRGCWGKVKADYARDIERRHIGPDEQHGRFIE